MAGASPLVDLDSGKWATAFLCPQSKNTKRMKNHSENALVEAFQFSATKQEMRTVLVYNEPWLVAKDVCDILGHSDTNMALKVLDDDEKLTQRIFGSGQNSKMWLINESGLYTLIMRSNKPEAKTFRKWVTSEVLPAIRKKGYFGIRTSESDFIDARDLPWNEQQFNGKHIRFINIKNVLYFSVNDIHRAIGSRTGSNQSVKQLNARQTLARKIWIYGNTHPAWFTNKLGFNLLLRGSRLFRVNNQLTLQLEGGQQ